MRTHLAAVAAMVPAGIDRYDTGAEKPEDYNPADWSASWTSADRNAWILPDRYVILSAPNFRRVAESLDDIPRDVREYVRVTAVGTSPNQARWVQEQVFAAFDRKHPTLTGFNATLRHSTADVFAKDDSVTPYRYYAVDTYLYQATPTQGEAP